MTTSTPSNRTRLAVRLLVVLIGLLIGFGLSEGLLRLFERRIGPDKFALVQKMFEENSYYTRNRPDAALLARSESIFDPMLGWRPFATNGPEARETLNSEHWRSAREFSRIPDRPRVIMAGDSFTYGLWVKDSETIGYYLEAALGGRVEVMNMACNGYALDQMALVAMNVAPQYHPDVIVIDIIPDDLNRSDADFFMKMKKPQFVLDNGQLNLTGVPLPSPTKLLEQHSSIRSRLKDFVLTTIGRSRLAALVAKPFLEQGRGTKISRLNAAILRDVVRNIGSSTRIVLVLLEGSPPPEFESEVRSIPVEFVSLGWLAKAEYFPDGHPKPSTNRIYAEQFSRLPSVASLAR
jgi:hypothetical protein